MPRMSTRENKIQLGDSWVVEGEDGLSATDDERQRLEKGEEEEDDEHDLAPAPLKLRRRPAPSMSSASDLELVMPSLGGDSVDGSWQASAIRRGARAHAPARRSTEVATPRRRSSRLTNEDISSTGQRATAAPRARRRNAEDKADRVQSRRPTIAAAGVLASIAEWALDVVGMGFTKSKWGLSSLLAVSIPICALWLLFNLVTNSLSNTLTASLAPICSIPGTSFLDLPFCAPRVSISHRSEPMPPVEFEQLMAVQSKFEEVLEQSAGSVSLPLDMKRGEASIRDLRQRVRYSSLRSKNELDLEFEGFIDTARIASLDLQRFNSHVGRAVDSVLATTRWTTRVLDGIAIQDSARGMFEAASSRFLALFTPIRYNDDILLDQYIQHTRIVEEEIHKLIAEAQAVLRVLNHLEDRLDVIHGIATRDDVHAKQSKEEILSYLWTMVGGNRGKLHQMDRQLQLLEQVGVYRKTAYAHVSGTILRLQEMGAGLEDLRERVAAPELLRDRAEIPLSVHIESIQRGVERLEMGRYNAREVENGRIKGSLHHESSVEHLIDG